MDLLKAEIERKRKAVAMAKASSSAGKVHPSKKYIKAVDLRRFQEQQEEEELRGGAKKRSTPSFSKRPRETTAVETTSSDNERSSSATTSTTSSSSSHKESKNNENESTTETPVSSRRQKQKTTKLNPNEITRALRSLGLPIRLFGEKTILIDKTKDIYDDTQREARLNTAKEISLQAMADQNNMDEYRLGSGHGIRNVFLGGKKDQKRQENDDPVNSIAEKNKTTTEQSSATKDKNDDEKDDSMDININTDDPHKKIHHFFKSLLRQWEDELSSRPTAQKITPAGKTETRTLKQCKDYIRPLFKLCKTRKLNPSLTAHLTNIVDRCQEGEFVKAHDAYMDVAIGRAAWPIGVTMVGIHARNGRARIESSSVAHVMNSELQRKYLTSVKRLMSYYQKKRDDVAPSKKVLTK